MVEPVTFITFIIPTIGRNSLSKAVQSVIDQPDWNWNCIVVFDGKSPNYSVDNSHVQIIQVPRQGWPGLVRNQAIPLVTTKWVAFLDDDDWLASSYIQTLKDFERSYPNVDIFQFTYRDVSTGNTRPSAGTRELRMGESGISFAVKTDFVQKNNISFVADSCEDYYFLNSCVEKGANYFVTNSTQYYVSKRGCWLP